MAEKKNAPKNDINLTVFRKKEFCRDPYERARYLLIPVLALLFANVVGLALDQRPEKTTWQFPSASGGVTIVLRHISGTGSTLNLDIMYEGKAQPSVAEEAQFVSEVLHDLSHAGADPQRISRITFNGFVEPEVRSRLAFAALHSKAWHLRTQTSGGGERVVEDLLNTLGLYGEFDKIVKPYGLTSEVEGVEKLASERCSRAQIPEVDCGQHGNEQVPIGANFNLVLRPIK